MAGGRFSRLGPKPNRKTLWRWRRAAQQRAERIGAGASCDFCKRPILDGEAVGFIVVAQPKGSWRLEEMIRCVCYTCAANFKAYLLELESITPRRDTLPPENLEDD